MPPLLPSEKPAYNLKPLGPSTDKSLSIQQRFYRRRREQGKCVVCGAEAGSRAKCSTCAAKSRSQSFARARLGRCRKCGKPSEEGKTVCSGCLAQAKLWHKALRLEALNAYGGAICKCCGITEPVFLALDHIHNDGAEDRRRNGPSLNLPKLKRQGWPQGFQVLCHNCNFAKQFGACPHKKKAY